MPRLMSAFFVLLATAANAQPLTQADQEAVKATIVGGLKDPDSAKFSALASSRQQTGEIVVCGTVNAKNGFGGYIGPMPFSGKLYDNSQFYLTKLASSQPEGSNLLSLCAALGAKIAN